MKKFSLISLGCPKNLTDSEEISARLSRLGYELSASAKTDVCVINTCAFLKSAVIESEKHIKEQIRLKRKKIVKKIIVAGCLADRYREKILEKYPQVDAILGVSSTDQIPYALKGKSFVLPHSKLYSQNRFLLTNRHSVYLKIADGCDNHCAYCTIPYIRGPLRSKPLEQVISEARSLIENGAVEVSLVAQDITAYGRDISGKSLLKTLLKKMSKIKSLKWLRLMYVYPEGIDLEILKIIRDSSNICHYLEMPLQHISSSVLKRMNRRCDEKSIKNKMDLIRKIVPDMALRSSFITGFPQESDKDFEKLLNFVKNYRFNSLAVFPYSREKGTAAYDFKNQLPYQVKKARAKALLAAQSVVVDDYNKSLVSREVELLADSQFSARFFWQAPDIDGYVKTDFKMEPGKFYKARIASASGYVRMASRRRLP